MNKMTKPLERAKIQLLNFLKLEGSLGGCKY